MKYLIITARFTGELVEACSVSFRWKITLFSFLHERRGKIRPERQVRFSWHAMDKVGEKWKRDNWQGFNEIREICYKFNNWKKGCLLTSELNLPGPIISYVTERAAQRRKKIVIIKTVIKFNREWLRSFSITRLYLDYWSQKMYARSFTFHSSTATFWIKTLSTSFNSNSFFGSSGSWRIQNMNLHQKPPWLSLGNL